MRIKSGEHPGCRLKWQEIVKLTCDTDLNAADPHGDGDQSVWEANTLGANLLMYTYQLGTDSYELLLKPAWARDDLDTPFLIACYVGGLRVLQHILELPAHDRYSPSKSRDWKNDKLEKRMSGQRFAALHYAAMGIRDMHCGVEQYRAITSNVDGVLRALCPGNMLGNNLDCLDLLLRAKARVNSRDICGNTPLRTLLQDLPPGPLKKSAPYQKAILKLITAKADPNILPRVRQYSTAEVRHHRRVVLVRACACVRACVLAHVRTKVRTYVRKYWCVCRINRV